MSEMKALQALVNETVLNAKYVEQFGEPEVNTIPLLVKHLTALQASSTFALKRAENLLRRKNND
jgi:hypothetical protein